LVSEFPEREKLFALRIMKS